MKKRILQVVTVFVCLTFLCIWGIFKTEDGKEIEDEMTPLDEGIGQLLCETEADKTVIPDKYNTGAFGELTVVDSDCYISGVKFGTSGKCDRKLDLYYQPGEVTDTILVENYDFSGSNFREYNVDKVEQDVTIIYKNCKFRSYLISGEGRVKREFENCSFTHFGGSDATFTNCYFGGGSDGDGINPMRNCTFTNCMIADLIQPADKKGTKHIDGFQIFGSTDGTDNTNIVFNNCRFEVPYIPMETPSGALNCPVSVIMRYSDADNISLNDCYVNGGLYYAIMLLQNDRSVTNLTITNMHIGGSSKSLYTCDETFEKMMSENVLPTDALYVSSVRKCEDGIHLSVTNDTNQERVLSILTEEGVKEQVIPACFMGKDLTQDSVAFSDFPFDIDIVIEDTSYVACFDTTNEPKQIRFVNWSGKDVYADLSGIFNQSFDLSVKSEILTADKTESPDAQGNTETDLSNVSSGVCGDDITYELKDGVLTISGLGKTYDFHSGNPAPWYDKRDEIVEVIVKEGVESLGNQLFSECTNLTYVTLPEGLITIGSNVFKKCNSIELIEIPKSLTTVGKRSFTSSVNKVKYNGSKEEWEEISFAEYNQCILQAEMEFGQD